MVLLEGFTALETVVVILALIFGTGYLVMVTMPPLFAWADRWIDRTRNKISDIVACKDD